MNIPMVNSIRLIHTVPPSAINVKKSLNNQDRADNLIMNKEYCLKLIAGGERDLDKLSELVGVNRTTIKKYLKLLHDEGMIIFICNYSEVTRIEGVTTKPRIDEVV